MTKAYLHGRTEAIRTVQPESVDFTKVRRVHVAYFSSFIKFAFQTFYSEASTSEKVAALRKACENHVKLTRDCGKGLGQDR